MREIAIIGDGRMGRALSHALRAAGRHVTGPLGRKPDVGDHEVVLLCVPDGEIATAARAVPARAGRLVGHVSGATTLAPVEEAGHTAFSVHPLMTATGPGARFDGAGAAIAGSTPAALEVARDLATTLGMRPFTVPDEDRVAYHAAASIASNFLLTIQAAAERLLGQDRAVLVPLVRATVESWEELGAERALTGPISRGDEGTVARQRAAIAERAPELLPMFDALAEATRGLAKGAVGAHGAAAAPEGAAA
jgi:predicted short-subunit dehydrogenase-like oxidoreductase (DUF2520 family)